MTGSTKICFKCGQNLPLTEFYRHPAMTDGTVNKCKSCNRKDVQANYRKNKPHYQAYDRERFHVVGRAMWRMANQRKLRDANPEKYFARNAVSNAVRDGRLQKLPCNACGSVKSQAHHEDYTKPLGVEWLCFPCHRQRHGQTVSAQRV